MNFLNPLALVWVVLIGIIIILYLLKLRRKDLVISSVLFWRPIVRDIQANVPFQKLKRNLLLFLQILILLLLIFGLARPFLKLKGLVKQNIVLIMDSSASMKSTDLGKSRFEAAKGVALGMMNDLSRGDRLMVIEAAARPKVLTAFTQDKGALKAVIKSMVPKDTGADIKGAMLLAASLVKSQPNSDIYILSDGGFKGLENLNLDIRKTKIHFLKFGKRADNVGITALDVRKSLTSEYDYQVFVTVHNFSGQAKKFDLELTRAGKLIAVREMNLSANSKRSVIFDSLGVQGGLIAARINLEDDLDVDNVAYAMVGELAEISILIVTEGNLFLEHAFNVDPRAKVAKVKPKFYTNKLGKYSITVFDNFSPPILPSGNYIFINCGGDRCPVEIEGLVERPSILDWDRKHPVMRYVDFSTTRLAKALAVKPTPWGKVLLEADSTPLIVAGEKGNFRSIFIGFDLMESNWVLRVSFPIFIANSIKWLSQATEKAESAVVRSGEVIPIKLPEDTEEITITYPTGECRKFKLKQNPLAFSDAELAGLYRVEGKDFKTEFAVNLLNRDESNTQPEENLVIGSQRIAALTGAAKTNKEIWKILVFLAILVICLEWRIYHRRL